MNFHWTVRLCSKRDFFPWSGCRMQSVIWISLGNWELSLSGKMKYIGFRELRQPEREQAFISCAITQICLWALNELSRSTKLVWIFKEVEIWFASGSWKVNETRAARSPSESFLWDHVVKGRLQSAEETIIIESGTLLSVLCFQSNAK